MQWFAVSVAVIVALGATIVALWDSDPVRRARPRRPEWLLPSPAQIRHTRIPLTFQGYDPDVVDATLDAIAEAYEELYLAAGPTAIARAEHRLAVRRGLEEPVRPASERSVPERAGQEVIVPKAKKTEPRPRTPDPRIE